MAAKIGYKEAAQKARPVLLEPIMKLEVVTPEDYMGDIIADLNRRRGQVEGMESRTGARVIDAKVPLSEQFGYVTVLRTLSSGRASSSMEFDHYAEVPKNIAKEVVEKNNGRTELV
ncbi:elongation factor G [Odoribacter laneus CAG:561]|nr:elongation factor G [Odoribacter laneus CAG:561]